MIQVCYSAAAATSDAVIRVAEEECAKFGKTAQLIRQGVAVCPMATPVTASYLCCPSPANVNQRYRCSAGGGQVERLDNDQVREALAAERRKALILIEENRMIQKSAEAFCVKAGFTRATPEFQECILRHYEAGAVRDSGAGNSQDASQRLIKQGQELMRQGAPQTRGITCTQMGTMTHCR